MNKIPTYEELSAQNSALKKQVKTLAEKNERLEIRNKELDANYNWILEQLKLSKKKIYGSSAEKIAEDYGQLNLFNEAELERAPLKAEPELEEITYKRKKARKKTYSEKYGSLPVEEIINLKQPYCFVIVRGDIIPVDPVILRHKILRIVYQHGIPGPEKVIPLDVRRHAFQ